MGELYKENRGRVTDKFLFNSERNIVIRELCRTEEGRKEGRKEGNIYLAKYT